MVLTIQRYLKYFFSVLASRNLKYVFFIVMLLLTTQRIYAQYQLAFDANQGSGLGSSVMLSANDTLILPDAEFSYLDHLFLAWNTQADGLGISYLPFDEFSMPNADLTLYAVWISPFATADYYDGIVAGSTVTFEVTANDTIGGVPSDSLLLVELISSGVNADVYIEDNAVRYSPYTTTSGFDNFSYVVAYQGALDTVDVLVLVFDAPDYMVTADCYVQLPKYEWELNRAVESLENDINPFTTPLVGDLFGDKYPEIVAKDNNSTIAQLVNNNVYIYHGSETPLLAGYVNFQTTAYNAAATTMAIAKVETASGLRPTLFVAGIDRNIYAYNPENGDQYWSSSSVYCVELGNNEGAFLGIADFNNDNKQEVYAANQIFDAATGAHLCGGAVDTDIGHFKYGDTNVEDYTSPTHHMMHTIAGDFNGDGDLELAAGRYLFDVDIANGTMPIISYLPSSASSDASMIQDGITVVADIDIDGDLDIIVAHQTTRNDIYCYVWDGQTPTLMAEKHINNTFADSTRYAVGVPFVGDLNGDGRPEIAFTASNRQYAFYYDEASTTLQDYYVLDHSDQSGFTGLTLFDFNNDKIAEIVYRDETNLRIINASGKSHLTGNDTLNADNTPILYNLAIYACESSTQSEFAVVADVDLDGQAEIVVTNNTQLNVFEAGGASRWVSARPVWNQYGYNVTNVNSDLTIPRYPINNSMVITVDSVTVVRPFNHFLQQMGNVTYEGETVLLTADLYVSNAFYSHDGNLGTLTIDIVNQGDADFRAQDSVVSFYCTDPEVGGNLLALGSITEDIPYEDTLKHLSYTFPVDLLTCPSVFIRLNDDGYSTFPNPEVLQQECDYENNTTEVDTTNSTIVLSSHFTWNGLDLDAVILNTGDTSDVDGIVNMLVTRGDTLDILPSLEGYVFEPLGASLPDYHLNKDTLHLPNVQEDGTFSFAAYKIPEVLFNFKTVVYNQEPQSGEVVVSSSVLPTIYYKNSDDTQWTTALPDTVGYYDMKVVGDGDSLYSAYADSIDSILVITPRPVVFILDVADKPYDTTDSVTSFVSVNNALAGDSLRLDITIGDLHFFDVNVGEHPILVFANWNISGPDAHNYQLEPYDTVFAEITKPQLTVTAVDFTKIYDGTSFLGGNGVLVEGFLLGDDVTDLAGVPSYSGSSQAAIDTGTYSINPSGYSSNNYEIIYVPGTLYIQPRNMFVDYGGADTIMYGDVVDMLNYTPRTSDLAANDQFFNDSLSFGDNFSSSAYYTAGDHTLEIGAAYILNASGDTVTSNYTFTFSLPTIHIRQKPLSIINAQALDKVYDSTTKASISEATLVGKVPGDDLMLSSSTDGEFETENVGVDIPVFTAEMVIYGEDANNYILAAQPELKANITPREVLYILDSVADKYYDGTDTIINRVWASTNDTIYEDGISLDFELQLAAANVAQDVSVNAITWKLLGLAANNYILLPYAGDRANILPVILQIKPQDISYVYGDSIPPLTIDVSGFIDGESLATMAVPPVVISDLNAKNDVGVYTLELGLAKDDNYDILYLPGQVTIQPRLLSIICSCPEAICANEVLDIYAYEIHNLAEGDTLARLDFDLAIVEDNNFSSGQKYYVQRGLTIILDDTLRNVTDNYTIDFASVEVEILDIPQPMLGDDLKFCGVCDYDFDAGEGISYLWSTGDTTRYLSLRGNYRGDIWVRVENANHCFNSDTVSIVLEGEFLKDILGAFIYPNPSAGQFNVLLSQEVTEVANIYNMLGNLIMQVAVDGDFFQVNIDVPDGVYLLEIKDARELFLVKQSMIIEY